MVYYSRCTSIRTLFLTTTASSCYNLVIICTSRARKNWLRRIRKWVTIRIGKFLHEPSLFINAGDFSYHKTHLKKYRNTSYFKMSNILNTSYTVLKKKKKKSWIHRKYSTRQLRSPFEKKRQRFGTTPTLLFRTVGRLLDKETRAKNAIKQNAKINFYPARESGFPGYFFENIKKITRTDLRRLVGVIRIGFFFFLSPLTDRLKTGRK